MRALLAAALAAAAAARPSALPNTVLWLDASNHTSFTYAGDKIAFWNSSGSDASSFQPLIAGTLAITYVEGVHPVVNLSSPQRTYGLTRTVGNLATSRDKFADSPVVIYVGTLYDYTTWANGYPGVLVETVNALAGQFHAVIIAQGLGSTGLGGDLDWEVNANVNVVQSDTWSRVNISANQRCIVAQSFDASAGVIKTWLNGVLLSSTTIGADLKVTNSQTSNIGFMSSRLTTTYSNAALHELIVASGASDGAMAAQFVSLGEKWDIAVNV